MKRFFAIAAVVILLVTSVIVPGAMAESRQEGTAAGVRYVFAHTGLQGYTFKPLPTGFRYEQRSWFGLGKPRLEVTVEKGRVLINGVDRGPIKEGGQLTVTAERRVLIDDKEVAR